MKRKPLFCVLAIILFTFSCDEEEEMVCPEGFSGVHCEVEDVCITQSLDCLNGGACIDGSCDCPDGFSGTNCQFADPDRVQEFLDGGIYSPVQLFRAGIPLDSLYGKIYQGGLIFHLDTINGTGLVAAPNDQSTGIQWGCKGTAIPGAYGPFIGMGKQNTINIINGCSELDIAARFCYDLDLNNKTDWFLPSKDELWAMYTNLHLRGYGQFNGEAYWSSTQPSHTTHASKSYAWILYIRTPVFWVTDNKDYSHFFVRAARGFESL